MPYDRCAPRRRDARTPPCDSHPSHCCQGQWRAGAQCPGTAQSAPRVQDPAARIHGDPTSAGGGDGDTRVCVAQHGTSPSLSLHERAKSSWLPSSQKKKATGGGRGSEPQSESSESRPHTTSDGWGNPGKGCRGARMGYCLPPVPSDTPYVSVAQMTGPRSMAECEASCGLGRCPWCGQEDTRPRTWVIWGRVCAHTGVCAVNITYLMHQWGYLLDMSAYPVRPHPHPRSPAGYTHMRTCILSLPTATCGEPGHKGRRSNR